MSLISLLLFYAVLANLASAGVQLSASIMASVCPEQQLSLTCHTNQSNALRWSITIPEESTTYTRDVLITTGSIPQLPIEVAGRTVTVHFSRQSVDPLTSTLSINSTSTNLDGTRISCSIRDSSAMTVIHIIGSNHYHLLPNQVNKKDHFGTANVTVTLEWTPVDNVAYSVSVVPPTDILCIMNTLWNLTLSYNTSYSVIINFTYCGYSNITTLMLKHVTCRSELVNGSFDSALRVKNMNYINRPALSGDNIIFQCSSGLVLAGPTSSTCMDDGQWEPDPRELRCVNRTSIDGPIIGGVLGVLLLGAALIITVSAILCLIKKGFLHPKRDNRLPDIKLENTYHQHTEDMQSSLEQPDTLVYADIGLASLKKSKHVVTLSPDTLDDRVEYALLNHCDSVQKPVVETDHCSVVDNSLNLDTLLIQIQGVVTSRWYQFGEALYVDRDVLDKCTRYSPEESIIEILDHWLRNFSGCPTWRDVAYALRKINLHQLANDIEKVYETGKLPIEIGDDDGQQMFSISALELPQAKEEKISDFNNYHQEESLPPLPPKPIAGSDESKKMKAPPRPPKYVPKS